MMATNNKLATEWLEQEFLKLESTVGVYHRMYELIEQAKRMERTNIEEAWNDGTMLGRNGWVLEEYSTGKEYVQRSYGNANTSSL